MTGKVLVSAREGGRFIAAFDLSIYTWMRAANSFRFSGVISRRLERRFPFTLPNTKNGNPHHVALNRQAMAALDTLKPLRE
jgi:hypothetical protein